MGPEAEKRLRAGFKRAAQDIRDHMSLYDKDPEYRRKFDAEMNQLHRNTQERIYRLHKYGGVSLTLA